jgi:hypothetical protein
MGARRLSLIVAGVFLGAGWLFSQSMGRLPGIVYPSDRGARTSATLNTALAQVGTANAVMILDGRRWGIEANVVVPTNITLVLLPEAYLDIATGCYVEIRGDFVAGKHKVFSGTGSAHGPARFPYRIPDWGSLTQYDIGRGYIETGLLWSVGCNVSNSYTYAPNTTQSFSYVVIRDGITFAPGTISHTNLSDLLVDGHTQYLNRDGSRPMIGTLAMGFNWISNDGDAEGIRIGTGGNLGVNQGTPGAALDVVHKDLTASNAPTTVGRFSLYNASITPAPGYGPRLDLRASGVGNVAADSLAAVDAVLSSGATAGTAAYDGDLVLRTTASTTSMERVRVTSAGNVGVGTNVPAANLHVRAGASGVSPHAFTRLLVDDDDDCGISLNAPDGKAAYLFFGGTSSAVDATIYRDSLRRLVFGVNGGTAAMAVNAALQVGIGTTFPDYLLTVSNSAAAGVKMTTDGYAWRVENSGGRLEATVAGLATRLRLLTNGNLCVGGINPSATLHLNRDDNQSPMIRFSTNSVFTGAVGIDDGSYLTGASQDLLVMSKAGRSVILAANGNLEVLRATSAGNVGIGTTAPAAKLHVNGVIDAGGYSPTNLADATLSSAAVAYRQLTNASVQIRVPDAVSSNDAVNLGQMLASMTATETWFLRAVTNGYMPTNYYLLSETRAETQETITVVAPTQNQYAISWVMPSNRISAIVSGVAQVDARLYRVGSVSVTVKCEIYIRGVDGSEPEFAETSTTVALTTTPTDYRFEIPVTSTNLLPTDRVVVKLKVTAVSGTPNLVFVSGSNVFSRLQLPTAGALSLASRGATNLVVNGHAAAWDGVERALFYSNNLAITVTTNYGGNVSNALVSIQASHSGYSLLRVWLTDGATPTDQETLTPPEVPGASSFFKLTDAAGLCNFYIQNTNGARWYVQAALLGEVNVSSAVDVGGP